MIKKVTAKIKWFAKDDRGRKKLPKGKKVIYVVKFSHQNRDSWLKNAWSLVIYLNNFPKYNEYQEQEVSFLMAKAPQHWLKKGETFTLHEGEKIVAQGIVT